MDTSFKKVILVVSVCLGFLVAFGAGVLVSDWGDDILDALLSEEEVAQVKVPQLYERETFSLQYPQNWSIDRDADDFDPDGMFSIDSPGSSYILFIVVPWGSDPMENVQEQRDSIGDIFGNVPPEKFTHWGNYEGYGELLKFKKLGVDFIFRFFSWSSEERSFIIVENTFQEDLEKVEPGLELIRKTFLLLNK